ncbi:hypothetical protein [Citricoccus sp.]|uniref:hypothetical protein n=1 Tax=Citricoccus sp. TaxID=1978372 RepID=UPI0028BECAC9|nr:hypothetical protein [Citricoccus sp.]
MSASNVESPIDSSVFARPFAIHCVDSYTYMGLSGPADYLGLKPEVVGYIVHQAHSQVVAELQDAGIDYDKLNSALVPKSGRHEVAFIFDSTQAEDEFRYGYSHAEKWIPVLKSHGPSKTAVSAGDVLELPDAVVWEEFEKRLVGGADFPRLPRHLYYVVHMTNLSSGQLENMHLALSEESKGYLGHVDCTTWNSLKLGLYLPQVALRSGDVIITSTDDEGTANLPGYPFEESGFRILGVAEEHYYLLLSHRMDNGIPAWAADDSSIALTALSGRRHSAATTNLIIDPRRVQYLNEKHAPSLKQALLDGLSEDDLAEAIKEKFATGLVYNLRFKAGARDGAPVPELDALLYSVQVEFPDEMGEVKRYQVGLKYEAGTHTSEVVTFY